MEINVLAYKLRKYVFANQAGTNSTTNYLHKPTCILSSSLTIIDTVHSAYSLNIFMYSVVIFVH